MDTAELTSFSACLGFFIVFVSLKGKDICTFLFKKWQSSLERKKSEAREKKKGKE